MYRGEAAGFDFPAPHTIDCRVVRFEIGSSGHYETLLTNLPRDEFPVEEMEKIYSLRWRIEQGFDALKNRTDIFQLYLSGLPCRGNWERQQNTE